MQEVGVFILFFCAVGYLVWQIVQTFRPTSTGCVGCSACATIDFDAIEQKIKDDLKG